MKKTLFTIGLALVAGATLVAQVVVAPIAAKPQSIKYPAIILPTAKVVSLAHSLAVNDILFSELSLTNLQRLTVTVQIVRDENDQLVGLVNAEQINRTAVPITVIQPVVTNTVVEFVYTNAPAATETNQP